MKRFYEIKEILDADEWEDEGVADRADWIELRAAQLYEHVLTVLQTLGSLSPDEYGGIMKQVELSQARIARQTVKVFRGLLEEVLLPDAIG